MTSINIKLHNFYLLRPVGHTTPRYTCAQDGDGLMFLHSLE